MTTLTITTRAPDHASVNARLTLPFDLRQRSRLLARLDSGEEVGLVLPRGTVLRGGDLLLASDGRVVQVVAAPEEVSVVRAPEARQLARAAYHLGNRHVALQVTDEAILYPHDHVLDDMLRGLGLEVGFAMLPFEPEAGAYSSSHSHSHGSHPHDHGHAHHH